MILVEYRVPVEVAVDLEAQRVLSVTVCDELVGAPVAFYASDGHEPTVEEIVEARRIARRALWPAWEVGY